MSSYNASQAIRFALKGVGAIGVAVSAWLLMGAASIQADSAVVAVLLTSISVAMLIGSILTLLS